MKDSITNPLVTVVMSAYNHEKYVSSAMESVLSQSHQNIEFLITDDGSSDATADEIRRIRDGRIKFTASETNRGACEAINSLLKKAKGEFICMMNSDDVWTDRNKIQKQLNSLKANPDTGACFGMADYIDQDGRKSDEQPQQFPFEINSRTGWLRRFFLHGNSLCHPTMMIRKECYENIGYYNNIYRQLPDYDFWIRLVKKYDILIINEKLISFRIIPGRNASAPSITNMIRDQSEHYLIRSRFLDDVSIKDFRESFHYEVSRKDIDSEEIFKIEKALLYFTPASSYRHVNLAIGIQKMALLMEDPSAKKVLSREYGIDDHWIHCKTAELDCFYKSQARICEKSSKAELNTYAIQKYLFKQIIGLFKMFKPRNIPGTIGLIKSQILTFKKEYLNTSYLKNKNKNILKISCRYKNALLIYRSKYFVKEFLSCKKTSIIKSILSYLKNWENNQGKRRPLPGFHPGIYASQQGISHQDPLVDYIKKGKPRGEWNYQTVSINEKTAAGNANLRTALQIHAYYPEMFGEVIERLNQSKARPELLVSVRSEEHAEKITDIIGSSYKGKNIIRITPNRGRDLGPLFTGFRDKVKDYDVIGHFHTKSSPHLNDRHHAHAWYRFLLENMIGGNESMVDEIIMGFTDDPKLGLVFPDDPHVFGWDSNYKHAQLLAKRMGISSDLKIHFNFPAGSMFWARVDALLPLFDLCLDWVDYPAEPIDTDGTMLHAMERLIPHIVTSRGFQMAATYVPGISY